MIRRGSVVGAADGVDGGGVTDEVSVAGTGVETGVAGAELVQPEESIHNRITRERIRILAHFMSRGLLFIPISDLRFV